MPVRAALCAAAIGIAAALPASAQSSDFHAIVERDGTVVFCVSKGDIVFADRCHGAGRLSIVQPVAEGLLQFRSATGKVAVENESPNNPECALSKAKWDPASERAVPSGRRVTNVPPGEVLSRLRQARSDEGLEESDITAFALDLDNNGEDEIIFIASNLKRIVDLHEKTQESLTFVERAGVFPRKQGATSDLMFPQTFHWDSGPYDGGTDTVVSVTIRGLVPLAGGDIGVLVGKAALEGNFILLRYRRWGLQRIETFEYVCN